MNKKKLNIDIPTEDQLMQKPKSKKKVEEVEMSTEIVEEKDLTVAPMLEQEIAPTMAELVEEAVILEEVVAQVPEPQKEEIAEEKAIYTYITNDYKLSKYLTVADFIKSDTATLNKIDNRLPKSLLENAKITAAAYDRIYEAFNGNVRFTSGYRCEKLNAKVGGSSKSQHKHAQAFDVKGKNGVTNDSIFQWVKKNMQFNQLIREYGTISEPKWIHFGTGTKMQILSIGAANSKSIWLAVTDEGDI